MIIQTEEINSRTASFSESGQSSRVLHILLKTMSLQLQCAVSCAFGKHELLAIVYILAFLRCNKRIYWPQWLAGFLGY